MNSTIKLINQPILKRITLQDDSNSTSCFLFKTNNARLFSMIKTYANENFDGETEIMKASITGNKRLVETLIHNGGDIHAIDKFKNTALIWASLYGKTEVVETLISNGADVNTADINRSTALMGASINGHVQVVEILTDKGEKKD